MQKNSYAYSSNYSRIHFRQPALGRRLHDHFCSPIASALVCSNANLLNRLPGSARFVTDGGNIVTAWIFLLTALLHQQV